MHWILGVAIMALLVGVLLALARATLGPTVFDRLQSANTIGTAAMLLLPFAAHAAAQTPTAKPKPALELGAPFADNAILQQQMPVWRASHPGVETLRVAVMGCVVNGPGESKHADIGISLPGTFEEPKAPVYMDGELLRTLRGDTIVQEFIEILDDYVERRFGDAAAPHG